MNFGFDFNIDPFQIPRMYSEVYKVRSLLEHSCAIFIYFKIVIIFNITLADFVLMSADVVLKMTTILKEMRIEQLCSKSERTLAPFLYLL